MTAQPKPGSHPWTLRFGARPSFGVGHRRIVGTDPPAEARPATPPRRGRGQGRPRG